MSSPFTVRVPRQRLDWQAIKGQADLEAVAEALLGPPGKSGSRGSWWCCPFHDEKTPSFRVQPDRGRWNCFGCGEHGDAAALVMKWEGLAFPEAVRRVAELCGLSAPSGDYRPPTRPKPVKAPGKPAPKPSSLPRPEAERIALEAAERLWRPEGRAALSYLHDRGLEDATIKAARLGFADRTMVPGKDGSGSYPVSGVCIPWFDGDRLARINVRLLPPWKRRDGGETRYANAFIDGPKVYPGPEAIRPGLPLAVCEGEFDALLLHQLIGDFACVATFGSATSPVDPAALSAALACPSWWIAHDADPAGDKEAAKWLGFPWCARVRPPAPAKDWTDAHRLGYSVVRNLWLGIVRPPGPSWEALEAERWGPSLGVDDAPDDAEAESRAERIAIRGADGIIGEPPSAPNPAPTARFHASRAPIEGPDPPEPDEPEADDWERRMLDLLNREGFREVHRESA